MLMLNISVLAADTANDAPAEQPVTNDGAPMQGGGRQGGGGRMGMPPDRNMNNGEPPQMPDGEMPTPPDGAFPPAPDGTTEPPQGEESIQSESNGQLQKPEENNTADTASQAADESASRPQRGDMPGNMVGQENGFGGMPSDMQANEAVAETDTSGGIVGFLKTYSTPITSVILLALAFVFVLFYKKKQY